MYQQQNEQVTNNQKTNDSTKKEQCNNNYFPRLKNLVNDIMKPGLKFTIVLGAGISVAAGFSAFRSNQSLFQKMQLEYQNWPSKSDDDDSFLAYAFSLSALRIDPRVQYRVLHKFDKSMQDVAVSPTRTHVFLQYLARKQKVLSIITQNIDDLEIDVGLEKVLNQNLIQVHGSLSKPPTCFNQNCPANLLNKNSEIVDRQKILYKQYFENQALTSSSFKSQNQIKFQYNNQSFEQAVQDNAVACCMFCGCALKPAMILYEENVNLGQRQMDSIYKQTQALLIIGTSLNVEPVSHIPASMSPHCTIHILSKDINFGKYLRETSFTYSMFDLLINKRAQILKYESGDKFLHLLKQKMAFSKLKHVNALKKQYDDKKYFRDNVVMNRITPLFNYHQGDCDLVVKELENLIPGCKAEMDIIQNQLNVQNKQKQMFLIIQNNQTLVTKDNKNYYIYKVFNSLPQLQQPDAYLYNISGKWYALQLITADQLTFLKKMFFSQAIFQEKDGCMYIDCINNKIQQPDFYRPIFGHWSMYCIAYNAYKLKSQKYDEKYDPWSANCIFSQFQETHKNDIRVYKNEIFRYYNVVDQFTITKQYMEELMVIYQKQTLEYIFNEDLLQLEMM